jgi:glyceraldehyde 3-phosphate dehydrogenase
LKIILDHPDLELVAINDLVPPDNLAYLLKFDTVYGRYSRTVESTESGLKIDGTEYKVLGVKDPEQLPWGELGVETVFEATGLFTEKEKARKHVSAGAKHVIISAPTKSEDVVTVVHGVNTPDGGDEVFSCASCTTNSITPVCEVMQRRIGVKKAMLTTVHAYTSTQQIVDGPSKKFRRGRAGAQNLVPTTTGAAVATTKVLTDYAGKFDGVAVRVPVPVGSISDITFLTDRKTTVDEVNRVLEEEAQSAQYKGVLAVTHEDVVSSDIIMDPHASIVDLGMTRVVDGDLVKVMAWYDNEWGYANQMVREAVRMAKA